MDFTLDEELLAVRDLAAEIFTDRATSARLREVESGPDRTDPELWAQLAKAGLLGIVLPVDAGGAGLGLGAFSVLLEEQGRRVAPVPLWSAGVGALAVAAHGTPGQRAALLPGAVDGSGRLTVALEEFGPADAAHPACRARAVPVDGDGPAAWRLTGTKAAVPSPFGAGHVLVAATAEQGTGLFLVETDTEGARWEAAETTTYDLSGHLVLDDAAAQAVGTPGTGVLEWLLDRASVALSAVQLGVAQGALAHAAAYLNEREQFGRPLATFQAVQHQLADCYIDIDAMRVTHWQAVSDLEAGAEAARAVLVARWWANEAGLNVVHRVQHLHGGIGVDTDYPVHRHFLWGRQIAGTLGGAGATLAQLGAELAGGGPVTP
ncbi:acyl-CoA dehydrogenase family protein [Streptomyces sp. NBC_01014]|uniref:acyl-CoA dehydrogenase family protein n=1 Tax=Streptomyces sp. NBC_01014 TaxID=2903719 RepID=UPI00386BD5AC|nr:acyl-CoA/acyl-ACP dehydrogenase [Streptomyces sp. NBC_01014]